MVKTELRSFHAVAKYGGFSAASRILHVSQPTLSTQVRALEQRYEVVLFNRVRREVHLTVAGTELYQITTRLFKQEQEAEDLLNSFMGLQSGTLNIAAVGPFHAIDMIVAFKLKYPNIDIAVQFGNSQRSFSRLLDYESDVGLIAEVNPDPRVLTIPYSTHSVVVFVNADHPFFKRTSISIAELQDQKVIQREPGSTTRTAVDHALEVHGVSVNPILDIHSREGIWKAVEQGLGIGFVADFEFVPHPNLKAIPINDTKIRTQYYIAHLEERKQSRLISAFCNIAKKMHGPTKPHSLNKN